MQSEFGLSEPEAFRWIQKTSMNRRVTMRAVAEAILAGDLPEDLVGGGSAAGHGGTGPAGGGRSSEDADGGTPAKGGGGTPVEGDGGRPAEAASD